MSKKGFFVVIEGGDGCGKSTLINNLKSEFRDAVFTREPGGTEYGEKIREVLFSSNEINKMTEMLIFASTRSEIVEKVLIPNLSEGKLIICDRYVYSSYVYQGISAGLGLEVVKKVNDVATGGLKPDLVIYLRVKKSLREGIENRFDIQTAEEAEKIYNAYDLVFDEEENVYVVEVENKSIEKVFEEAKKVILERINGER